MQRVLSQTFVKSDKPSPLRAEALCGDWDGHAPQATIFTFWTVLDMHMAKVGFSEPWLFSGHLTPGLLRLSLDG